MSESNYGSTAKAGKHKLTKRNLEDGHSSHKLYLEQEWQQLYMEQEWHVYDQVKHL